MPTRSTRTTRVLCEGEDDGLAGRGLALTPLLDQRDGGGDRSQDAGGLGSGGSGTGREGKGDGPQRGRLSWARGLVRAEPRGRGLCQAAEARYLAPVGRAV